MFATRREFVPTSSTPAAFPVRPRATALGLRSLVLIDLGQRMPVRGYLALRYFCAHDELTLLASRCRGSTGRPSFPEAVVLEPRFLWNTGCPGQAGARQWHLGVVARPGDQVFQRPWCSSRDSSGILDAPVKRGHDSGGCDGAFPRHEMPEWCLSIGPRTKTECRVLGTPAAARAVSKAPLVGRDERRKS
jgi:hypothetical protein